MISMLLFLTALSAVSLLYVFWLLSLPDGMAATIPVPEVGAPAPDYTFDWTGLV